MEWSFFFFLTAFYLSIRHNYVMNIFPVNCWKDENKKGREWAISKNLYRLLLQLTKEIQTFRQFYFKFLFESTTSYKNIVLKCIKKIF